MNNINGQQSRINYRAGWFYSSLLLIPISALTPVFWISWRLSRELFGQPDDDDDGLELKVNKYMKSFLASL